MTALPGLDDEYPREVVVRLEGRHGGVLRPRTTRGVSAPESGPRQPLRSSRDR